MFASLVPAQLKYELPLCSTALLSDICRFNEIWVTKPSPQADGVLSARIDTIIKLRVSFHPGSPIRFLKLPKTRSVHEDHFVEQSLKFSLELRGAGSENVIGNICPECKNRKNQATWDIVDFRAPTTNILIENRTATVEFFIKCYAWHHGEDHHAFR